MDPSSALLRRVTFVAALVATAVASAQVDVSVPLEGIARGDLFDALATECYEAGLAADAPHDSILDCTATLEERSAGAEAAEASVVVRHKIRFTLLDARVAADAWTETEELGTVIETPITDDDYLRRVRYVLAAAARRLRTRDAVASQWSRRYDSEQAWLLDAHLHAVSHCDAALTGLGADLLGAQLESIGIRPMSPDTRDRCEQLYERLFEWGLGRGDAEPTLDAYAKFRAALPLDQRACTGRLALDAPAC
jgi:hypothetical protein